MRQQCQARGLALFPELLLYEVVAEAEPNKTQRFYDVELLLIDRPPLGLRFKVAPSSF
jgi:hypothetical protein